MLKIKPLDGSGFIHYFFLLLPKPLAATDFVFEDVLPSRNKSDALEAILAEVRTLFLAIFGSFD
jgi:hypothetical protein